MRGHSYREAECGYNHFLTWRVNNNKEWLDQMALSCNVTIVALEQLNSMALCGLSKAVVEILKWSLQEKVLFILRDGFYPIM